MKSALRLAIALVLATLGADIALAQQNTPAPRPAQRRARVAPAPPPVTPAPAPPPVTAQEKPLIELSEILGSLALAHQICTPGTSANPWRTRMETLLDAEGESSGAREKMIGAYNRGFSEYATSYRQCTDTLRAARRVLARDAARVARDLERRFGS